MNVILEKLLNPSTPIREQEEALDTFIFMIGEGHGESPIGPSAVAIVQEVFAKNLILNTKGTDATKSSFLASREELTEKTINLVQTLLRTHSKNKSDSALSNHTLAAPLCALVLQTLLQKCGSMGPTIQLSSLYCMLGLWNEIDTSTLVAFLPGTVSEICKILADNSLRKEQTEIALSILRTALIKSLGDVEIVSLLKEKNTNTQTLTLDDLRGEQKESNIKIPTTGMKRRTESEALQQVGRDLSWYEVTSTNVTECVSKLINRISDSSGWGMVQSNKHQHLELFAKAGVSIAVNCKESLPELAQLLLEFEFLNQLSQDSITSKVNDLTHQICGDNRTLIRDRIEILTTSLHAKPQQAVAVAGYINYLKQETFEQLSLISTVSHEVFLPRLLRGIYRTASAVGSEGIFRFFSHQPGSVLGSLATLLQSLTRELPLPALVGTLTEDLLDFEKWRHHHSILWCLNVVVKTSSQNSEILNLAESDLVGAGERFCEELLPVINVVVNTPEYWYFDDGSGCTAGDIQHCSNLLALALECFSECTVSVLSRFGDARLKETPTHDRFLLHVVFPIIEKTTSKHSVVADAAKMALKAVAVTSSCGIPSEPEKSIAMLIKYSFDWLCDAVSARLPFLSEFPDTPNTLATSLQLLESLLSTDSTQRGADKETLLLLKHACDYIKKYMISAPGKKQKPELNTAVLRLLRQVSSLLSKSVRLKQAEIWEHSYHERSNSIVIMAIAGAVVAAGATTEADVEECDEEEGPSPYSHQEIVPFTEETIRTAAERELSKDILLDMQHQLSSTVAKDHFAICNTIESCILVFCTFDGISDRLQTGRTTQNPTPFVADRIVVNVATNWLNQEISSDVLISENVPKYNGGICSTVLNPVHLLWGPLLSKLLPTGFSEVGELLKRLTPKHISHFNDPSVRNRLKKLQLPTVDLGACVIHIVEIAVFLLIYVRDFTDDRIRKELWPLLKYHLTISEHVFHQSYTVNDKSLERTSLFRFHKSTLLLLIVAFPHTIKNDLIEGPSDGSIAQNRRSGILSILQDVKSTTTRFTDCRQPQPLQILASQLHQHLDSIMAVATSATP
eukprot:TRINITY_DN10496_c0_g4_i2.p1 TRINITY_DN10496_c0_g4~~TRINITY_DN10496_c0_g4_i2.p1  ORF type:complete len:1079 (+),score=218.07 TRINITY_DN10496_c0_g4_i2:90-3326(+)